MTEKVPARDHQIKKCTSGSWGDIEYMDRETLLAHSDKEYWFGTRTEVNAWVEEAVKTFNAIRGGNYINVGEEPTPLCDACLRLDCRDSGISRNLRGLEVVRHHLYTLVNARSNHDLLNSGNEYDKAEYNSQVTELYDQIAKDYLNTDVNE